jgi:hypothetical protein
MKYKLIECDNYLVRLIENFINQRTAEENDKVYIYFKLIAFHTRKRILQYKRKITHIFYDVIVDVTYICTNFFQVYIMYFEGKIHYS